MNLYALSPELIIRLGGGLTAPFKAPTLVTVIRSGKKLFLLTDLSPKAAGLTPEDRVNTKATLDWEARAVTGASAPLKVDAAYARQAPSLEGALLPFTEEGAVPRGEDVFLLSSQEGDLALQAWRALTSAPRHRPAKLTRLKSEDGEVSGFRVSAPSGYWVSCLQEEGRGLSSAPENPRDLIPLGTSRAWVEVVLTALPAPPEGEFRLWGPQGFRSAALQPQGGLKTGTFPLPADKVRSNSPSAAGTVKLRWAEDPARDQVAEVLELRDLSPLRDFLSLAEEDASEEVEVALIGERVLVRAPHNPEMLTGWAGERWVRMKGEPRVFLPEGLRLEPALRRDRYADLFSLRNLTAGAELMIFSEPETAPLILEPKAWVRLRTLIRRTHACDLIPAQAQGGGFLSVAVEAQTLRPDRSQGLE